MPGRAFATTEVNVKLHRTSVILVSALATVTLGCGSDNELSADAGSDFTVSIGETPTFDGCDSTGDITNFKWTIIGAPPAMPDDAGKSLRDQLSDCSFDLENSMIADEIGSWIIELEVSDGDGQSSSDTVGVTVEN